MRYRVYYQQDGSCTDEDFCVCYANSETEAVEVFHKYHPDDVVDHVERRTGLYDMSTEGDLESSQTALSKPSVTVTRKLCTSTSCTSRGTEGTNSKVKTAPHCAILLTTHVCLYYCVSCI